MTNRDICQRFSTNCSIFYIRLQHLETLKKCLTFCKIRVIIYKQSRMWRNWQTRMVQVHVKAISWGFKSLHPHQSLVSSETRLFLVFLAVSCYTEFIKLQEGSPCCPGARRSIGCRIRRGGRCGSSPFYTGVCEHRLWW